MEIPLFGLGTYLLHDDECRRLVTHALARGVRLIDTAAMYENEAAIGDALAASPVPRDQIFLVSKLALDKHSYDGVFESIKNSLTLLKTPYLDLFLIHTPRAGNILECWKACLDAKKQGLVRNVGVSNFGPQHVEFLMRNGLEMPLFNEYECHVWNQQKEFNRYFENEGIKIIGYCPLARGKKLGLDQSVLAEIAREEGQSEALVALRWSMSRGLVTIPKTSKIERLDEMVEVLVDGEKFRLSEEQMRRLDGLHDPDFFASNAVKAMFDDVEEPEAQQQQART